jgi:enamine deaminase RidA (YjgF/YER057c/UK114 family)
MIHIFCGVLLSAGLAGCANQPDARGVFWWPQGPGTTAEDLRPTAGSPKGDLLFVSGQIACLPGSEAVAGNGLEGQVHRALDNAMRVLKSNGLRSTDIVSVTLYTRDIDDLQRAIAAYSAYFPRILPARAVVGVEALGAGSLVEIAVIARK